MTKPKHEHVRQAKIYLTLADQAALERIGDRLATRSASATVRRMIEIFDSELVIEPHAGQDVTITVSYPVRGAADHA